MIARQSIVHFDNEKTGIIGLAFFCMILKKSLYLAIIYGIEVKFICTQKELTYLGINGHFYVCGTFFAVASA
ncbi:MAG: hypothetical protein D3924_12810 [Candidatus Electrothrix sp. AR4]|nr:hypothetical protein [Candidatus Electrothrix sp. AR4]